MVRLAVYIALVLIVMVAGGCPRRISDAGREVPQAGRANEQRVDDDAAQAQEPGIATDDVPGEVDALDVEGVDAEAADAETDEPADTDGLDETVAHDNGVVGETNTDDLLAQEEPATDDAVAEPDTAGEAPAVDEPVVDAVVEVIEEEAYEPPSFSPEPPKVKLSREARNFAGNWQAVVYDFSGESEHATGERFVILNDEGSFEATALNRDGQMQSGIWSKDEGVIALSFGPAGEVEYTIDQATDNIAIWHGPSGGAMFCIRLPDETMAMSPGERYESGFGPVEFSRSGPGYWKGSYGDPEGTLVLQNAGQFLYGTWEQGKQAGYAILEFDKRGFEGYWWYSGQTSFGGEWRGEL